MDVVTKQIVDSFQVTLNAIRDKFDEINRELKKGRADPVAVASLKKIESDHDKIKDDLNALFRAKNRPNLFGAGDSPSRLELKADKEFGRWHGNAGGMKTERKKYGEAFERYALLGKDALGPDEIKTLSAGSSPDGGFFVEPFRARTMIDKIYETSEVRRVARVVEIAKGTTYTELIDRDEAGSGWVGEQSTCTETDTSQLGELIIPTHEQYAMPTTTQALIDEANINVEEWVNEKVADRFGRQENSGFVTGNGVSKPRGFTTYPTASTADSSRDFGTLQYIATGSSGAFKTASATVNPADDLLALIYAFKAGFRRNLRWAGTRVTLGKIRTFKDQQGNYIYTPSIGANGVIDSVFGFPWDEFSDMADYSTGDALGIGLADWQRAYVIVDKPGIRMLRDPFTSKGYVKFYAYKRVGGAVRDSEALKFLKFGTS